MKKIIVASLMFLGMGFCLANTTRPEINNEIETKVLKSVPVKYITICGTVHYGTFNDEFDSPECLENEWEFYNREDCGHASWELPMV